MKQVKSFFRKLEDYLSAEERTEFTSTVVRLVESGMTPDLAERVTAFDSLYCSLDIIKLANANESNVDSTAILYFGVGSRVNLPRLRKEIDRLAGESAWQTSAKAALKADAEDLQRNLTVSALNVNRSRENALSSLAAWDSRHQRELDRIEKTVNEIRRATKPEFSMIAVAFRQLRDFLSFAES